MHQDTAMSVNATEQLAAWPTGNGEMASRIRNFDWASTPLGPIERWPQALRTAVDLTLASPVAAIVLWGPEYIQIYNDLWTTLHPGRHPAALGQRTHECFAELVDTLEPVYQRARHGEGVVLQDSLLPVMRHGSVENAWWDVTYTPVRGTSGAAEGIFCTLSEITTKVIAARALREVEQKQRLTLQLVPALLWWTDPVGRVVTADQQWKDYTGQSDDEVHDYGWLAAIHPDDVQATRVAFEHAFATGEPVDRHQRIRRIDGSYRWHQVRHVPVRDENWEIARWFGAATDVHELHQLEERQSFLLKLSDTIRALPDPTTVAITVTRMVADHFKVDRCFISRISKEEGKAWVEHETRKPDLLSAEGEVNLADFPEVMRIAETNTMVFRDVQADPDLSVRDKAAVAGLGLGAFIAAVLRKGERNYFWDLVIATNEPRDWSPNDSLLLEEIAERTWVAIERTRTEKVLLETEKLAVVGRLASSIAHEINNPLEALTNLLYLMEKTELPAEAAQYLHLAQAELNRVSEITVETLRFSKRNTTATAIRISDVMESVINLHEGKLKASGVVVGRRYRDNRELICFPNELRQVIANLIGNAIDSMSGFDRSRLCLRVRDAYNPKTGNAGIRLTVADTGSGMSRTTLSRIWEPFFTTKGATGTGLGLWVSHEIILKHRGSVSVHTSMEPHNRGTVFSLFLPHIG